MQYLLKLFIAVLLLPTLIQAAQWAIVQSEHAIIYSDLHKKSPIGFVKRGKKIRVGEVKRKHGEFVPVVVSGNVAYIETRNLLLEKNEFASVDRPRTIREHQVFEVEDAEPLVGQESARDNYLSLKLASMSGGDEFFAVAQAAGESEEITFSGIGVYFDNRPRYNRFGFGFGLTVYSGTGNFVELKIPALELFGSYTLIKSKYYRLDLGLNGLISGASKFTTIADGQTTKASIYGLTYQAIVRLFPTSKFGAYAGVEQTSLSVSGLENLSIPGSTATPTLSKLSGISISGGISYKF